MDLPNYSGDISKFLGRQINSGEWGSINGALGYDNSRANYDFQAGGNVYTLSNNGNGTRSVSQTGTVADRLAKKAASDRLAAVQPAIDSYNAAKPEITSAYATERARLQGEVDPLNERYKKLLDDIKGNQTTATNRQTLTTGNEMAKRGISSDSGMYQQEMTNVLNPINAEYSSIEKDANFNHEDALRAISDMISGLVPKETADQRSITQAIANLQADTGNRNVDTGLNLYYKGLDQANADRQFQENVRQFGITEALQKQQYNDQQNQSNQMFPIQLAMAQLQLDKARKPTGTGGSGIDFSDLISYLGGGSSTPSSFQGSILDPNTRGQYGW